MKKFIVPLICYMAILLVLLNLDTITDFISKHISDNNNLTIPVSNEYKKEDEFLYVQKSIDYKPYSYHDLINIFYSIINSGFSEFTFYCPEEYTECLSDASNLSKDDLTLTHINNFVHPFNSFQTIKTSISEAGEITIYVTYLYTNEEIEKINNYVDKLINEQYDNSDDDYENIKKIHDYIINNTKYDVNRNNTGESEYKSYSAIGIVEDGYATCNGYADLMAIILSKLNYKNYKIATTSDEISYESNGHIWNALELDGEWLHLDLTWDDPVSSDGKDYLYHKYFLVTTEELNKADDGNITVEEHNFDKSIYQEFKN